MITTLLEIAMTKFWMAYPPYFNALRQLVQDNIAERKQLSSEHFAKRQAFRMGITSSDKAVRMEDPDSEVVHTEGTPEVQSFVAILPVCGPITRNGDACSYGSIDLRDAMIEAANQDECAGIVLYINSGGGSADAIADIKYAIDYVHQHGLKVTAFIDGMCASAAYYYAVLCDEICYMNDKDQIGSIGAFAAFYTQKDGEKNEYTNETFHVVYADQSYDKNKWYREATDGNYDVIKEELNKLNEDFIADVRAARPNAKDEHLHGAMFNATDVQGVLVDRQSTLEECCNRLATAHKATTANVNETNTKTFINMQKYPLINAACGMKEGEIKVSEDGAFMNAPLLDALEAHLANGKQKVTDTEQKVTTLEQNLAELQGKFDNLSAQLTTVNEAKTVAAKNLVEKDKRIAELTEAKQKVEIELKGAKNALATAEQNIADKDARIAELANDCGKDGGAGASPANNGEGAKVQTLREFDPSPYKTNSERKAAFEKFKRGE